MFITTEVKPDMIKICSSRGEAVVSQPEKIDQKSQGQIVELEDLAGWLKVQSLLEELQGNLDLRVPANTDSVLAKLAKVEDSASGDTLLEKYVDMLEKVCVDGKADVKESDRLMCKPLGKKEDRLPVLARLEYLRPALAKLKDLKISASGISGTKRLLEIESKQTVKGKLAKTKAAVDQLISELAKHLEIDPGRINENNINAMIKKRCDEGVYQPVITPPVKPRKDPGPAAKKTFVDALYFSLGLMPAYSIAVSGSPLQSGGASLRGNAAVGWKISEKGVLQADYLPYLSLSPDFTSRTSQDQAALSFGYKFPGFQFIGQASFLWDRNFLTGEDNSLWAGGAGASFSGGWLYLFGGGIFGTAAGGYGGIRSSHAWDKFRFSAQAFYSSAVGPQAGGSVLGELILGRAWRIGLAAGGGKDFSSDAVNLNFGLILKYSSGDLKDQLVPQPIRWSGF